MQFRPALGLALSLAVCFSSMIPSAAWAAEAAEADEAGIAGAATVHTEVRSEASDSAGAATAQNAAAAETDPLNNADTKSSTAVQGDTASAEPATEAESVLPENPDETVDISDGYIYIRDGIDKSGIEYKGTPVIISNFSVHTGYGYKLTEGEDYIISYVNNDRAGTATMIATGIGSYSGELRYSFKIKLRKDGRAKTSNLKYNSATLMWTKIPGAAGYNIYRSSMFGYGKFHRRITTGATNTLKLSLRPNVGYIFEVVPFALINGKRVEYEDACMSTFFNTPICYNSKYFTSNSKLQKSLGKVLGTYKDCRKFKGGGECYGYAEWASKMIAKSRKYVKINKKLTSDNVRKYICTLKPGAHVRISGHSLVIIKASRDVIYWADNNYNCEKGRNRVHYWTGTPEDFAGIYHAHAKIEGIYKTTAYR